MMRGSVSVMLGGAPLTVIYDWQAIGALQEAVGKDFDLAINAAAADIDLPVVATALAIGLRRHHPDVTAEAIFAASPPIAEAIDAVRRGLTAAFKGAEGPAAPEPRPPGIAARIRAAISSLRPASRPTAPA